MVGFLFVVMICACIYLTYYFRNKNLQQRRQILLLKKLNSNLKEKTVSKSASNQTISIKYAVPQYNSGKIIESAPLHAAPIENSIMLMKIEADTSVQVKDSAEIGGSLWYEIVVNKEEDINNKGWVRNSYITFSGE
jgi:hypothetical protein